MLVVEDAREYKRNQVRRKNLFYPAEGISKCCFLPIKKTAHQKYPGNPEENIYRQVAMMNEWHQLAMMDDNEKDHDPLQRINGTIAI